MKREKKKEKEEWVSEQDVEGKDEEKEGKSARLD